MNYQMVFCVVISIFSVGLMIKHEDVILIELVVLLSGLFLSMRASFRKVI